MLKIRNVSVISVSVISFLIRLFLSSILPLVFCLRLLSFLLFFLLFMKDGQGVLERFYTSAQNAAFVTPHKTRGNANPTFKGGSIHTRGRIYTSASHAFSLALAQRPAFPTRYVALSTQAFVTLCNLH